MNRPPPQASRKMGLSVVLPKEPGAVEPSSGSKLVLLGDGEATVWIAASAAEGVSAPRARVAAATTGAENWAWRAAIRSRNEAAGLAGVLVMG